VASSPTLEGLVDVLNGFGANGTQARRTIEQYRRAVNLKDASVELDAPVNAERSPPVALVEGEGPFYVMEVQPS
jgi:hypothetical protein